MELNAAFLELRKTKGRVSELGRVRAHREFGPKCRKE